MKRIIALGTLIMTVFAIPVFGGSLQPSAAPMSGTMKPLSDVEPRIAIHQSDLPMAIGTSGSYYLAENVTSTDNGIIIGADNVTIDLNGFTLAGSDSASPYGIYVSSQNNIEIRNGTIQNFVYGICESSTTDKGQCISNVHVTNCSRMGIYMLCNGSQIRNCIVSDIGLSSSSTVYGICGGPNTQITGNSVYNVGNSATASYVYGIYAGSYSFVSGNTVSNTGQFAAGRVYGIYANSNSAIRHNVVSRSGVSVSGSNPVYGIYSNYGCTVSGNISCMNGDAATTSGNIYGIYANNGVTVSGNNVYYNGLLAAGNVYGVNVGIGCTVMNNSIYYNGVSATGTTYGLVMSNYGLVNNNTIYYNGINLVTGTGCVLGTNVAP